MRFRINPNKYFLISLLLGSFACFGQTVNSHGQAGYINTPNANMLGEGSMHLHISRNSPDRKILVTASPFNWIDASIFYVDLTGKAYGVGSNTQSYKDKGFNFKFLLLNANRFPSLAIGINDFAGTGIYGSEYVVMTDTMNRFEYSIGLGWGRYGSGFEIKNPLIYLSDRFSERSQGYKGLGGSTDFGDYFSGGNASLFAGASYNLLKNLKFLFEYDPTNSEFGDLQFEKITFKEPETNFNIGAEYKYKNGRYKIAFNRGNTFLFDFSIRADFLDYGKNISNVQKAGSYQQLQRILELNSIGLKAVESNLDSVHFKVRQNSYPNQTEVNRIVLDAVKDLASNKERIFISQDIHNMEVIKVFYPTNKKVNIRDQKEGNFKPIETNYVVNENFPIINNQIVPTIRTMIAAREGFLFSGLLLEDNFEVVFSENLYFVSNFKSSIIDDFDGLFVPPVDVYPNQVRSDIKNYLNNFDAFFIGRMELNYYKSFQRKHFFRLSGGIFEEMFGGIGVDYLYYPQNSFYALGLEIYKVRKRDYQMDFNFQEYSNTLPRISFQISEPKTKINFKVSYGEYLAGDVGATYEFFRRFKNGVKFSAFFSRTDVSTELYGEGSFDKGVRFVIPVRGLFQSRSSLTAFEWHPLTKDPAALLHKSVNLIDEIGKFRIN